MLHLTWPNGTSIPAQISFRVHSQAGRWTAEAMRLLLRDNNDAGEMAGTAGRSRGVGRGKRRVGLPYRDRVVGADCEDLPRMWQPSCVYVLLTCLRIQRMNLDCVALLKKIMLIYFLLCEYMLASSSGYNDRLITHLQVQAVNVKYLKLVFIARRYLARYMLWACVFCMCLCLSTTSGSSTKKTLSNL